MDITAVSVVYANPFYAQNYTGMPQQPQPQQQQLQIAQQSSHQLQHQQQHQIYHTNYVVTTGSTLVSGGINQAPPGALIGPVMGQPRPMYGDLYRFEDGGGDASGSLLLGQDNDDFCASAGTSPGNDNGIENDDNREESLGFEAAAMIRLSASSTVANSTSSSCSEAGVVMAGSLANQEPDFQTTLFQHGEMNGRERQGQTDDDDVTDALQAFSQMGERTMTQLGVAESMLEYHDKEVRQESEDMYPQAGSELLSRLPRPCAFMNVGQEQYLIQPDTVFVLGMRLNVTKNDIILYFGKLGLIKMNETTNKPKIFVYKNKLTGRSKGEATITYVSPYSAQAAIACLNGTRFLGQQLTVLPAYLSTRKGSVRFSYPRETNVVDQQRRQRQQRWKPASDNWVCLVCRNSNFVWRSSCNRCQTSKRSAVAPSADVTEPEANSRPATQAESTENGARRWRPHKSDWPCGFCFNMNFWYRIKCNRCRAPRTEAFSRSDSEKDRWELVGSQAAGD
ncbi:hypothetical protein KR018_000012 [Drosophila ironensis]|nr:hypothetical protein KR018_000012 [Drosophila ironensis]